jgi:protein-L-isoaspartate(D-aspartate) O-methyltransferase
LAELAPSVSLVSGSLAAGWPTAAPYDVILIEGGVPEIPRALGEQLRQQSGRLVAVCADSGRLGEAVLAEATPAGLRAQPIFDCATPPIPQLVQSPGFVF